MKIGFLILLFVLGAAMGSFACCMARRMREREMHRKKPGKWSVCMKCKKRLKWYDNIPIISWLVLGGRCRYCKAKIGAAEILAEVMTAVAFVVVGMKIDIMTAGAIEWGVLALELALMVILTLLAVYDGMWGELPSICLTLSVVCAIMIVILQQWSLFLVGKFTYEGIGNILGAVIVLAVLYLVLYLVSKGKWVGSGDWILGLAIALVIGEPWLATIILMLSNLLGFFMALPKAIKKKEKKVYFGPFMIVAFIMVLAFSEPLMGLIK